MRMIIFFMLLFAPCVIKAQNSDNYLYNIPQYWNNGDTWAYGHILRPWMWENGYSRYIFAYVDYYSIEGDTLVDNKQYWKVYYQTMQIQVANKVAQEQGQQKYYFKLFGIYDNNLNYIGRKICQYLIREDEDRRQWVYLNWLDDEYLMWDFSQPFEEGNSIKCGYLEGGRWQITDIPIHTLSTHHLTDGTEVPLANDTWMYGYGDVNSDIFYHFYYDASDNEDGRIPCFFFRNHNGIRIHQNEQFYDKITEAFGMDFEDAIKLGIEGKLTDFVTSVKDLYKDTDAGSALYDLTGRRLTREPEKGMYIKDGRKYLKL